MIIDYTYFEGIISIGLSPNIGSSAVQIAERERIAYYIDVYEEEYLRKVLGTLYTDFIAYLDSQDSDVIFDKVKAIMTEKYSPIAGYVYFKYLTLGNYHITRMGAVAPAEEKAVSPAINQVRVWNDMVDRNNAIRSLLQGKKGYSATDAMFTKINDLGI